MSEQNDSVGAVLAMDEKERATLRERIEKAACFLELGSKIGRVLPTGATGAAAVQVAEQLHQILETPLSRILTEAWSRDPALSRYATGKGAEVALVPLADHTVESSHKPFVELLMEEAALGRVDFKIDIAVKLTGAMIGIRGGRIVELRAGVTRAAVSLSCAGSAIAKRDREIKLPGVIRFGEGIPIAPQDPGRSAEPEPPLPMPTT
jgi:hypothetical protein